MTKEEVIEKVGLKTDFTIYQDDGGTFRVTPDYTLRFEGFSLCIDTEDDSDWEIFYEHITEIKEL